MSSDAQVETRALGPDGPELDQGAGGQAAGPSGQLFLGVMTSYEIENAPPLTPRTLTGTVPLGL